ncbi:hypothetical protein [Gemmata sp.]|uniref:hypothetical protein n=1 Tax=Gemmata sp. TaxID=1914242 RepID=UPI003F723826
MSERDEKVAELKKRGAEYIAEARAGSKLLTSSPSVADAKKQAGKIRGTYSSLPPIPAGYKNGPELEKCFRAITDGFDQGEEMIGLASEFKEFKKTDKVNEMNNMVPKIARLIQAHCEYAETILDRGP